MICSVEAEKPGSNCTVSTTLAAVAWPALAVSTVSVTLSPGLAVSVEGLMVVYRLATRVALVGNMVMLAGAVAPFSVAVLLAGFESPVAAELGVTAAVGANEVAGAAKLMVLPTVWPAPRVVSAGKVTRPSALL